MSKKESNDSFFHYIKTPFVVFNNYTYSIIKFHTIPKQK